MPWALRPASRCPSASSSCHALDSEPRGPTRCHPGARQQEWGEGSTTESTRGCGEGKAPFPQEPPSRPKDTHPLRKRLKKQVYCGTPGCTDEWNGNAPRRVRIIMIRIKNRAVERLHHDAFFCFFFSFSSFSFSISATYFSISSGFNIYQREFKVSLQAMRAAPEEGRPLAADDQKVDATPQLGTALQGAKGMWERRHHGGWSAGSPPGACAAPPTLMPAGAAAGAAITLRGWSRLMIASSMFLPPD